MGRTCSEPGDQCTFTWVGDAWVKTAGGCSDGETCPTPTESGSFIGQEKVVSCQARGTDDEEGPPPTPPHGPSPKDKK